MKPNTNNSPLPIAFLSSAPPNHTVHPQAIHWDFMDNPKHQMIQKAFTLEWLYILTFALWVCLLLEFNPRPPSRRHRVAPPEGWEAVLLPCPAPCSAFSWFPTSSKKRIIFEVIFQWPSPLLSKAFSKCVFWLESKGRQGKLVFGGKEKELQSSLWTSARLSWRASWGWDINKKVIIMTHRRWKETFAWRDFHCNNLKLTI